MEFTRMAAKLGFPVPQFHDLRGNARDIVLDRGLPVHVVAVRCGHDPATLLRSCAKRTRKAGTSVVARSEYLKGDSGKLKTV